MCLYFRCLYLQLWIWLGFEWFCILIHQVMLHFMFWGLYLWYEGADDIFFTLLINHYPINGDPWPLLMRGEYLTSRVPTPNWIAPFYISLQSSSFILCYKVVPPCTTMLNSKGLYRDALSRYKRFWYQNSPSWFLRYSFILCGNIHLLYPKYASPITFRIYVLNWHWWRGNLQAIYDSVPTTAYDITLFT